MMRPTELRQKGQQGEGADTTVDRVGDLAVVERLWDELGEIACLTFVRGVNEAEALRRLSAYPDTIGEKDPDEILEFLEEFDFATPVAGDAGGRLPTP
jgi:hypothetical protein